MPDKKPVLVREHLFTVPASPVEKPHLIGSRCQDCGEVVFPALNRCPHCCSEKVTEELLGPRGTLYSFTVIYQIGPLGYSGPVPYGIVKVDMPEGVRVMGYCTENDPAHLKPGLQMELIIDKLFTDVHGNDVTGYKFKPVND